MVESKKYTLHALLKNCEIRKVILEENKFTDNTGKEIAYKHILLVCDEIDNDENRIYLKDKQIDNYEKYHRGDILDISVRIDVEEGFKGKTSILVTGFTKSEV